MADDRDEIRARVDIVDLVGQRVQLKRSGKNWKGLCPFHEDRNPSFYVTPDTGRYKCWSCGEHGDVFTWVMKTQNVDFVEALQTLAKRAGVELSGQRATVPKSVRAAQQAAMDEALAFFREQLALSTQARAYCERRRLDADTLERWEIGYAPDVGDALATRLQRKGFSLSECRTLFLVDQDSYGGFFDKFRGRLIFPIRDEKSDLVAFGGRLMGDGHPKYINSGDTPLYRKSRVLYGMYQARDTLNHERRAVLCEGYLDVIACHRAGVSGALASLGTSLAEEHARLLKRWCAEVVILYDRDAAGQKAALRAVEVLAAEKVRVRIALMPAGEDPDTLLESGGPGAVQRAVAEAVRPVDFQLMMLESRLEPTREEFWTEAFDILAGEPSEMELDRHIVRLATLYPGVKDQIAAQRALRAEIRKRRQPQAHRPRLGRPQVPAPLNLRLNVLSPAETVVFRAVLEEPLRSLAWDSLAEPQLFATEFGVQLASAIRGALGAAPPIGRPVEWIGKIESPECQTALSDLAVDPRVERLTPEYVRESIEHLRREQEVRETERLKEGEKDEDRLRDIYARIRQQKL